MDVFTNTLLGEETQECWILTALCTSFSSARASTLYVLRRKELRETFSFGLVHQNWFLATGPQSGQFTYHVIAAYDNSTDAFSQDSAYILQPFAAGQNLKMNCRPPAPVPLPGPTAPPIEPKPEPHIPTLPYGKSKCVILRIRLNTLKRSRKTGIPTNIWLNILCPNILSGPHNCHFLGSFLSHGILSVNLWPNRFASPSKVSTCVELAFRLATYLRGLASTCTDFGRAQSRTQVHASFSPLAHPTQVETN